MRDFIMYECEGCHKTFRDKEQAINHEKNCCIIKEVKPWYGTCLYPVKLMVKFANGKYGHYNLDFKHSSCSNSDLDNSN